MSTGPNRRDVLKIGAGAVAAASLAGVAAAEDSGSRKRSIKKAVMIDMVRDGKSVLEKFELLKQAGFDGVEMNSPGGPPNAEIKEASKQTGLLIEGVVDSVHWKQTLSDPDPSVRKIGLDALHQALRDCKELGGTSVLLVPGIVNKAVSYADCYKRSQEEIRKALPLAQELGVKIAIEDVWNNFLLSPLEAVRYIDEFENPQAIGWHFDIGNIIAYGWPEQWIRTLGPRIVKLHAKDYSREKMNNEGRGKGFNVKLLEGDNDWPAVMKALDEVGYHTWLCAEVSGGGLDVLKDISDRLDKILAM
jgi:L-ribulose-5-phosphate 3-epimerase